MRWITAVVLTCLLVSTPAFAVVSSVVTHTFQSAAVATGNGTALDVSKYNSLAVQLILAGTATVSFEGTVDTSNWVALACTSVGSTSATLVTSATASGLYQCNTAGLSSVRMRISAWTSGAVTVSGVVTTAVASKKGGAGSSSPHALLDGTQNNDTVAGTPVRGDIICANSTPAWVKLARGSTGQVLYIDSSGDCQWGTVDTSATTFTFTNKTIDCEATGNVCTLPKRIWFPAAGCNNATAGTIWDLPTSNPAVAACVTGTNTQKGVLEFADSASLSAQTTYLLPTTWTGTVDARIKWVTAATSGNIVWQLATICVADAETDDPAFNTASTVTDAAKGTTLQTNDAAITTVTVTGCAAGELMHVKILRDSAHASDTLAATARLIGVELTIREAM